MTKVDIGFTFGRLTVIAEAPAHVTPNGAKFRMWDCQCICGGSRITREARLLSGETVSCGCRAREVAERLGDLRRTQGAAPSYAAVHARLRRRRGTATNLPCADCGDTRKKHQWSYIRGCPGELLGGLDTKHAQPLPYCLHLDEHYAPRCRTCHRAMDTSPEASVRRLRAVFLAFDAPAGSFHRSTKEVT